jgi:hypothetical protein
MFVIVPSIAGAQPAAGACETSASLSRHLKRAFRGWKPVNHTDLTSERRDLFIRDHPTACPGKVSINFFGDARPTIALSLWRSGKALLVLARERSGHTWSTEILDEGNEAGVVWKEGPGEYEDVRGERRVRVVREGLVWCGYESWAVLYALVDGKVEKVWLSD